jgi:hypothetical protein
VRTRPAGFVPERGKSTVCPPWRAPSEEDVEGRGTAKREDQEARRLDIAPASVSLNSGPPDRYAILLQIDEFDEFSSKVDGFVVENQRVNLRMVGQG